MSIYRKIDRAQADGEITSVEFVPQKDLGIPACRCRPEYMDSDEFAVFIFKRGDIQKTRQCVKDQRKALAALYIFRDGNRKICQ